MICWSCEHEWDADKRSADADCFVCGAEGEIEEHTILIGRPKAAKVS